MDNLIDTINELTVAYVNEMIQKNKYKHELQEALKKIEELEVEKDEGN